MMKRLLDGAAFVLFSVNVFFLTCSVAFAQTTDGSITVQTIDATKALVSGTHLVLTDVETNVMREGTTLKSGTYTFGALPPATTGSSWIMWDSTALRTTRLSSRLVSRHR